MFRKTLFFFLLFPVSQIICPAQSNNLTTRLLDRPDKNSQVGELAIYQDPAIDSLIYRYILYNERLNGMEGFRIQIYSSSDRNAKEESGKISAEFMNKFPDIVSYPPIFDKPSYYKVRVGDYRTRIEGTKYLLMVRKVFPDAYLVPDIINFPDLNKK